MHGVLVIDKPAGVSSAMAVERVRRDLRIDRAGHGGTLDPLATGVLPICVGAGTKLAQFLLADDKAYEAEGMLGVETDTLDRTGRIIGERPVDVTRDALLAVLTSHRHGTTDDGVADIQLDEVRHLMQHRQVLVIHPEDAVAQGQVRRASVHAATIVSGDRTVDQPYGGTARADAAAVR